MSFYILSSTVKPTEHADLDKMSCMLRPIFLKIDNTTSKFSTKKSQWYHTEYTSKYVEYQRRDHCHWAIKVNIKKKGCIVMKAPNKEPGRY